MRRLVLLAGVLLGLFVMAAQAQQLPPATAAAGVAQPPPGVHLDLTMEQTKLIVDVLGQAQCGPLSVSTLALCQSMTDLLKEIRRQAAEQLK